jgi:hypothetical protein
MKRSCKILTLVFLAAAGLQMASGAVVYTESFPNSSTAKNFATVGWNAHVGSTAESWTTTSDVSSTSDAVIWNTNGMGGTIGYGFGALGSAAALYWTTEPGALDVSNIQNLSFYSNNGATTSSFRFALRLDNGTPGDTSDDFWVASATAFNSSSGGSSSNWGTAGQAKLESLAFSTSADSWRDLTFVAGSSLSLSGSARTLDLPAGNVTAFGLLASGGTVRFDNFAIDAVPEPSAFAISGLASILLVVRRRRVTSL